ncbi:hypothetical protein CL622_02615 [archaeon]|nr:hypothetical protein [archaeon]
MFSGRLEKIVILFVVLVGLAFTFLVPPFQKADEVDHFYKSVGLTNLIGCPKGILCVESKFFNLPLRTQADFRRWDYEKKYNYDLLSIRDIEKEMEIYAANFSWQVTPLSYVFSSLGVLAGNYFENPLAALYLGRFFNFCFYLACLVIAIRIIPVGYKNILLFFSGLPMVLHQVSAVSHDAIGLALVMVVFAWWLRIWERNKIGDREYALFVLLTGTLSLIKYGNWFLFLIASLVPTNRVSKKVKGLVVGFFITLVLITMVWGTRFWQGVGLLSKPISGNFHGFQSDILWKFPLEFLRVVFNSLSENGLDYIVGLVGRFGWLMDYRMGFMVYLFYTGLLVLVIRSVSKQVKVRLNWVESLVLVLAVVLTVLGVFVGMYLYEGRPGREIILVQGRYFLVIIPFLLYFLVGVWQRVVRRRWQRYIFVLLLVLVGVNILVSVRNRYGIGFSRVQADDYLKIRGASYRYIPVGVRDEYLQLVDGYYSRNFGNKEREKILGFEFVFNSNGLPVNVPYRFYLRGKDCQKNFVSGFLEQEQLEKEGVYRFLFDRPKQLSVNELCFVLEPYYRDDLSNFLSLVEYEGEFLFRFLRPEKYILEEPDLERGGRDLSAVNREKKLFQTFTASRKDLTGIGVMIDSEGRGRNDSAYKLALYDESCLTQLKVVDIERKSISHGYFADVFFEPITDSRDKKYCFALIPADEEAAHPISFFAAESFKGNYRGRYDGGELYLGREETNLDAVFRLFYDN